MKKTTKTLNKITILRDTREQNPWLFEDCDCVETVMCTIPKGDYSLQGFDDPSHPNSVIVERKSSSQELIGNIGKGWDRFKRELEILSRFEYKMIVVERAANFNWLVEKKFTSLHTNFIYKRIAEIYADYNVPIYFLESRDDAQNFVYRVFKRILECQK